MAFLAPDKSNDDHGGHNEKELVEPPGDSSGRNTITEKKSSLSSPKHFKKSSISSSSAIDETSFKVEDHRQDQVLMLDVNSSNPAAERSQWVLNAPEPPGLWQEFKAIVMETISTCGNKYSSLKDQSLAKRIVSVQQQIFPILVWGRNYKATKFKHDLMAGLTIASLCIPQVINTTTYI